MAAYRRDVPVAEMAASCEAKSRPRALPCIYDAAWFSRTGETQLDLAYVQESKLVQAVQTGRSNLGLD
jgi:hypothetical protein